MYLNLLNSYKRFIRGFTVGNDEKSFGESEERVGIVIICSGMWLFQSIFLYIINLPIDSVLTSIGFLCALTLLFLLRFKIISQKQFNHLNVLIAILGIWAANMDAGMGVNPSLIWFGTLPLFSVMLTGIRDGLCWSIFSALLSFFSMILTKKLGYTFNEYNPEQWNMVATSNMITAPILYFGTFAYIYSKKDQKIEFNQKFADVGKSSAFIMHEISKPINRIMQKNCNVEDEIKSIIEIYSISESIRKNQFDDIVFNKINLNELVNVILEKYKTFIEYYSIQIELNGLDIFINSDRRFIEIVIDNLIRNAIEACSDLVSYKFLRIAFNNGNLLIENSSSKRLMSIDQLTSPMKSSKPGHLGIGLYVAKNLMNGLGGDLFVDNNKPGNTFQVRLKI